MDRIDIVFAVLVVLLVVVCLIGLWWAIHTTLTFVGSVTGIEIPLVVIIAVFVLFLLK